MTFILIFHIFFAFHSNAIGHLGELFLLGISLKISLTLISLFFILDLNKKFLNKFKAAKQLDQFNNDDADTYQNAHELFENPENYSKEILEKIYLRADKKSQDQLIKPDSGKLKPLLIPLLVLLVMTGLLVIFRGDQISKSWEFFALKKIPEVQHKTTVDVIPGNLDITRNSTIMIEVIDPESDVEHTFFYRRDKVWREKSMPDYSFQFDNLDYPIEYYIKNPYAVSDTFKISVYDLPAVMNIDLSYDYPQYTGMKKEFLSNTNGNIKALIGTKIGFSFEANNPLESAGMIFFNGDLQVLERTGKKSFKTSFYLNESGSYHINLIDILGNKSRKIAKSITAIADKKPEVKILYPGKDTLLTQNLRLPLKLAASDDFGLKNLNVFYHVNDGTIFEISIKKLISEAVLEMDYILDFNDLYLIPGDKVTYWIEIGDNSPESQVTESRKYIARFPSIEEIYEEIEAQEKEKSEILQETLEKSEEIQKEYEEKRRELLRKEEFDWEDKKSIEDILKKQEMLNQDVKNVAEEYQKLSEKFQNNDALAQETLDKMEKIQELMEEISNEDLMKAMENLQKNLDNIDSDNLKKAMEDLKFSLEDFTEKLQQTIDLLEAIKKEQALQKALEISEEMEEMQTDLNEKTSDNGSDLTDEQQKISEKLDALNEQLEKMEEMLDQAKDRALLDELQKLKEQMQNDSLSNDLQESMKQLQENNNSKAQQSQEKALEKMQKMNEMLSNMQQMMSSSAMSDMGEIIKVTIRRLLLLSYEHEKSQEKYVDDPFLILSDQIANYEAINISMQKLYSVPMIMFALGPKFVYDANYTNKAYREMFQYINDAKKYNIPTYLNDIVKGINLMIFDLMQASNNMQQNGGGGGGMQSLMQALQQMGQEQMAMNMLTQKMMQQLGQNGKLTNDMRGQAQRLAQEEERLAENLRRMLQNSPEAQKQTGAINKIIDDLENISRNLKRGRINQDLVDQQERILSRLLDAQKSVHKREFSKKRKAETSEIHDWDLPEEIKIKFDKLRQKALLEEEYKNFPTEYQQLIKEYLKLLNERVDELK